jgi:hypothetical protein
MDEWRPPSKLKKETSGANRLYVPTHSFSSDPDIGKSTRSRSTPAGNRSTRSSSKVIGSDPDPVDVTVSIDNGTRSRKANNWRKVKDPIRQSPWYLQRSATVAEKQQNRSAAASIALEELSNPWDGMSLEQKQHICLYDYYRSVAQ